MSAATDAFVTQNQSRLLEELKQFLRIPSISTLPENRADVERAANFVADALHAGGHGKRRDHSHRETSAGLCRLAARSRQADGAVLRPLRRAAGRSAGTVDHSALRTYGARRQPLWPRHGRRQGPDVLAHQGHRGAAGRDGHAAGESQVPGGRRGGGGRRIDREVCRRESRKVTRRCRAGVRHGDVRGRHADAVHRAARADLHGGGGHGSRARSAFRAIWRRGAQRGLRTDRTARARPRTPTACSRFPASTTMWRSPRRPKSQAGRACLSKSASSCRKEVGSTATHRRTVAHGAGARLVAADLRSSRDCGRLHGRGREDGDSRQGRGQGEHPPGAAAGSGCRGRRGFANGCAILRRRAFRPKCAC